MSTVATCDPEIAQVIENEQRRQRHQLVMIASENYTSAAVLETTGSVLTNKYAEGYPGRRYYAGCENVDVSEQLAIDRAKQLFGAEHANVQPHSGSQANMAVLMTFLEPGDTVLGLDLAHGGHLTHGSSVNFSGQLYQFISYHVSKDSGRVDFGEVQDLAQKHRPKLIVCGGSAYPRFIEFAQFREIADSVNAYLLADIAHPSGLVAAGLHPSPMSYCDVVTSTTHKTLRGPRGGIIMMGKDMENSWGKTAPKSGRIKMISELIDSTVMPGIQGGPLMHIIGAKAVAFGEALQPEFTLYAQTIIDNAKTMAEEFLALGYDLISGGTDTHLLLLDLTSINIDGKTAEQVLGKAGITVNKNMIPFDQRSPFITSGIRLGTPAVTTRGMGKDEMRMIVSWIDTALKKNDDETALKRVKKDVHTLCSSFPVYDH